jgi:hypothetical protein
LQEEVTPRRFADLVRIPLDGGDAEVIVHTGIGGRRPFVTRAVDRVFFTTSEGVVSVRGDAVNTAGSDKRVHLRVEGLHAWTNAGNPHPVGDVVLSPDGKWALTIVANQLYLMAVPLPAQDVPVISLIDDPRLPRKQISRYGADYYSWANDGQTIIWSLGSTFYRRQLDDIDWNEEIGVTETGNVSSIDIAVEVPRDIPEGKLLLRGATVITMSGDEVIEGADILIINERIRGIGKQGSFPVPEDAVIRDLSGHYITPGFVDTHAHWYEIRHELLDLSNWSFLVNLAFGITSGLDVQAMDQDMFVYQDLLDAGLMVGPRAWSVGKGMFANNTLDTAQDAEDLVKRYVEFYGTPNIKSYLIGDRRKRQWIVQAARKFGAIPTTEGGNDLELDLTHAIDGFAGNEHALPIVPLYEDVVRLFAETKIGYTPTLLIVSDGDSSGKEWFFVTQSPHDDPKIQRFMPHYVNDTRTSPARWVRPEERMFPRVAESVARIFRAGGRIGVGSHAEFQGIAYHWEMEALGASGLSPHEVLRAATDHGSQLIGRGSEIGTLEVGKLADLLVLAENPLADIKNTRSIRHVMKNGRLYEADTLDEIWPRQLALSPAWHSEE